MKDKQVKKRKLLIEPDVWIAQVNNGYFVQGVTYNYDSGEPFIATMAIEEPDDGMRVNMNDNRAEVEAQLDMLRTVMEFLEIYPESYKRNSVALIKAFGTRYRPGVDETVEFVESLLSIMPADNNLTFRCSKHPTYDGSGAIPLQQSEEDDNKVHECKTCKIIHELYKRTGGTF